ncbi:MAG: hypothetical protein EP343_16015 [Deltaproteobacteria bacterium]|nr:MAG: hypothetical protein EP343_16015 [Deltaproteobacteria bacterium]
MWDRLSSLSQNLYVQLFLVLGVLLAILGRPVPGPFVEYLYLPSLVNTYNPAYAPSDWTLASPFYEHLVFNKTFGLLTLFLPLEWLGWLGRITFWTLLVLSFFRLGRNLGIPLRLVSLMLIIWLIRGQSVVASSPLFGGFEAKSLSYWLLLTSINLFLEERWTPASLLLGAAFSFHPGVGLCGGVAVGFAVLLQGHPLRQMGKMFGFVFAASLPGLYTIGLLLSHQGGKVVTSETWRFFCLKALPYHMDPFSWPLRSLFLLFLFMIFGLVHTLLCLENHKWRFVYAFQFGLGLLFALGMYWRWAESYSLLRYFPFRLFGTLVPLFFLFHLSHAFKNGLLVPKRPVIAALGFITVLSYGSPVVVEFYDQATATLHQWRARPDDISKTFRWLRTNTPNNAIAILPPWRTDSFHATQRGQIANLLAIRHDSVVEWRARLQDLLGKPLPTLSVEATEEIKKRFLQRTTQQIQDMGKKYKANYLVSRTRYPFPVLFRTPTYNVYDLRPNKPSTKSRGNKPSK